jgi:hypothetical protein
MAKIHGVARALCTDSYIRLLPPRPLFSISRGRAAAKDGPTEDVVPSYENESSGVRHGGEWEKMRGERKGKWKESGAPFFGFWSFAQHSALVPVAAQMKRCARRVQRLSDTSKDFT